MIVGVPDGSQAFGVPVGFSIPMAPGTELRSVYQRYSSAPTETTDAPPASTHTTSLPPTTTTTTPSSPTPSLPPAPQQLPPPPSSQPASRSSQSSTTSSLPPQLPPPPSSSSASSSSSSGAAAASQSSFHDDFNAKFVNLPSTTAQVLPPGEDAANIPIVDAVFMPQDVSPPSNPTAPMIRPQSTASTTTTSASSDVTDDSFTALQARLAALRDL